jgi:energy-coupling factor transporter ATP-binding protein EcfA2
MDEPVYGLRQFPDHEALEDAFRERIATLIPRRHAGSQVFWEDFQQLYRRSAPLAEVREAYITSNPRDCLAFGTAQQVLTAAALTAAGRSDHCDAACRQAAARFDLAAHLYQPVRSLSGGETVRLALAKLFILAPWAARLTVASPFAWLSQTNRRHFYDLADHCRAVRTPLEAFVLQGEDDPTPPDACANLPPGPEFQLRLQRLRIQLGGLVDSIHNRQTWASVDDGDIPLRSPCLVRGDNGQGKSLIARALAGALVYRGRADIRGSGRRPGPVRLLFQDIDNQTLMRSSRQISGHLAGPRRALLNDMYAALLADVARAPGARSLAPSLARRLMLPQPASMLETKALLAAVRLAARPAALILDEPDWGLSRTEALAFAAAVIRAAHGLNLPLMLISHKPWWRELGASQLTVSKHALAGAPSTEAPRLFHIGLEAAEVPTP